MGKVHGLLDERLVTFIQAQRMFFVATAPSGAGGYVNLSPKGLDGLRVLGSKQVAYLDYPGSGIETASHLRDNGRIVIMLCAFEGPPFILRLYGRGRVVEPGEPEFQGLLQRFAPIAPPRSIIVVDLERIADSCGYAVPRYQYLGERDQLVRWANKKEGAGELEGYCREKNAVSIDGLPGLRWVQDGGEPSEPR